MKTNSKFLICICNDESEISLEIGKVYRVVKPEKNDSEGMVRIIDESGEDYLFPVSWFVPVKLSARATGAIDAALSSAEASR